jgi:hypothetical protein
MFSSALSFRPSPFQAAAGAAKPVAEQPAAQPAAAAQPAPAAQAAPPQAPAQPAPAAVQDKGVSAADLAKRPRFGKNIIPAAKRDWKGYAAAAGLTVCTAVIGAALMGGNPLGALAGAGFGAGLSSSYISGAAYRSLSAKSVGYTVAGSAAIGFAGSLVSPFVGATAIGFGVGLTLGRLQKLFDK